MRLVKSEEEEEESTMETLTQRREIRLLTKLALPPTSDEIRVVDLGMSAEAQQEDAHADPAMKIQASIISDVVNGGCFRQRETISRQKILTRTHGFCLAHCFSSHVCKK